MGHGLICRLHMLQSWSCGESLGQIPPHRRCSSKSKRDKNQQPWPGKYGNGKEEQPIDFDFDKRWRWMEDLCAPKIPKAPLLWGANRNNMKQHCAATGFSEPMKCQCNVNEYMAGNIATHPEIHMETTKIPKINNYFPSLNQLTLSTWFLCCPTFPGSAWISVVEWEPVQAYSPHMPQVDKTLAVSILHVNNQIAFIFTEIGYNQLTNYVYINLMTASCWDFA